jgi:hypothetical protein
LIPIEILEKVLISIDVPMITPFYRVWLIGQDDLSHQRTSVRVTIKVDSLDIDLDHSCRSHSEWWLIDYPFVPFPILELDRNDPSDHSDLPLGEMRL